jgi:CubicO group peptidase (beta-lactamase class C family)
MRVPGRGGASFVVRHRDELLVDIWGGYADPRTRRPWTRESLGFSFSTSKGVSATIIHRLADRGLLAYDEPVAAYWPEFAANGKQAITVRQLMTHQAGLDALAPAARNLDEMLDHVGASERLAACRPRHRQGTPAYHAITYGWLLAGLARAITGREMGALIRSEICEPLGIEGMQYGIGDLDLEQLPALVGSLGRVPALGPVGLALLPVRLGRRALETVYVPGVQRLFEGRDPAVLHTEMPAVNGMFTASALATMYGALANGGVAGGRRLLSTGTVEKLGRVQTRAADRNLVIPMLWRLGYHQAFVPGAQPLRAFGHYGLSGSGGWADPDSGTSVAFVTNRVYPVTIALGDLALELLSRVAIRALRASGTARVPVLQPPEPLGDAQAATG